MTTSLVFFILGGFGGFAPEINKSSSILRRPHPSLDPEDPMPPLNSRQPASKGVQMEASERHVSYEGPDAYLATQFSNSYVSLLRI